MTQIMQEANEKAFQSKLENTSPEKLMNVSRISLLALND